jgi:cytochrome c oxidase subunit 3
MAALTPPVEVRKPSFGEGSGGVLPPKYGGGGDNGPGDGSPDYSRRLRRARLGLLLGLASISVLFVVAGAIFFLRRNGLGTNLSAQGYRHEWIPIELPLRILLVNTFVLLLSSVSMEMARRAVTRETALAPLRAVPGIALERERGVPWLATTVSLGVMFLVGQWMAWQSLRSHGFPVSADTPAPFIYILTAAHAVHLAGGILVLLYAGVISALQRAVEQRLIVVEIAGWYWHFMAVLWLYIFALLQFGR